MSNLLKIHKILSINNLHLKTQQYYVKTPNEMRKNTQQHLQ